MQHHLLKYVFHQNETREILKNELLETREFLQKQYNNFKYFQSSFRLDNALLLYQSQYLQQSMMGRAVSACKGWKSAEEPLWRTSYELCCCRSQISEHQSLKNSTHFINIKQESTGSKRYDRAERRSVSPWWHDPRSAGWFYRDPPVPGPPNFGARAAQMCTPHHPFAARNRWIYILKARTRYITFAQIFASICSPESSMLVSKSHCQSVFFLAFSQVWQDSWKWNRQ